MASYSLRNSHYKDKIVLETALSFWLESLNWESRCYIETGPRSPSHWLAPDPVALALWPPDQQFHLSFQQYHPQSQMVDNCSKPCTTIHKGHCGWHDWMKSKLKQYCVEDIGFTLEKQCLVSNLTLFSENDNTHQPIDQKWAALYWAHIAKIMMFNKNTLTADYELNQKLYLLQSN